MRGPSAPRRQQDQVYPHGAVALVIVAMYPSVTRSAKAARFDLIAPPFTFVAGSGTGPLAQVDANAELSKSKVGGSLSRLTPNR
jgi:hypothetical protein